MSAQVTDDEIRSFRRTHPESIDMLMVAIHSSDLELRSLARAWFAARVAPAKTRRGGR